VVSRGGAYIGLLGGEALLEGEDELLEVACEDVGARGLLDQLQPYFFQGGQALVRVFYQLAD
jgi:hypothetical protein